MEGTPVGFKRAVGDLSEDVQVEEMQRAAVASLLIIDANLVVGKVTRVNSGIIYVLKPQRAPIAVDDVVAIKRASLHACALHV